MSCKSKASTTLQTLQGATGGVALAPYKVEIEYDPDFYGGDYSGVGNTAVFEVCPDDIEALGESKAVRKVFKAESGLSPKNIVFWQYVNDEDFSLD